MKVLDLFSGIGGFSLGLEQAGMETIAFCEIEKYPQKVLAKHWSEVPIAQDVTKLTYSDGVLYDDGKEIYRGTIDAICGGFPCQDISVAGKQEGIKEGTRSGLWSECARLLREIRPEYAIFENVTALISGEQGRWFQRVLWDISEVGYDAEWHCIPASELGAHHHRDRVWIIAYPSDNRRDGGSLHRKERDSRPPKGILKGSGILAESGSVRIKAGLAGSIEGKEGYSGITNHLRYEVRGARERKGVEFWHTEPCVGRVANGVSSRSHRLKALGNAVVPQIPQIIGRAIMEYENENNTQV